MTATRVRVKAEFWATEEVVHDEGRLAEVEVAPDDHDAAMVAVHTFVHDRGSVASYYLSRDQAVRWAHDLLRATLPEREEM